MKYRKNSTSQAVLLFILLLPYIEPQIFKTAEFGAGDSFFMLFKAFSIAFVALFYVISCKPSRLIIGFCILQLWLGISTLANHASLTTWLGPACGMLVAVMIFELALQEGRLCVISLLRLIKLLLLFYLIINILSFILYGYNKEAHTSFLGIDNRWIFFYLPVVGISFLIDCLEYGDIRKSSWLIWVFCVMHVAIVFSAGALVALSSIPILIICFKLWSFRGAWGIAGRCIFGILVLVNFAIISGVLLDFLSPIIVDYFHKDITLAGRTLLWKVVLNTLASSPFFGHGMFPVSVMQDFFYINTGFVSACIVNHPHNFALYFAMNGGWPSLCIFAAIIYYSFYRLDQTNNSKIKICLLVCTTSVFLAGLIDSLDFVLIWLIVCCAYYAPLLDAKTNKTLIS